MKILFISSAFLIFFSCTKEVPEAEKNISKSIEENLVRKVVTNYYQSYNSNDIPNAISFFDPDYKGIAAESDDIIGTAMLQDELNEIKKQYPDGKWKFEFEEISLQNNLGYIITQGSFLIPDPIEGGDSPQYSERCLRIVRKTNEGVWKIYRSFSIPIFSYD